MKYTTAEEKKLARYLNRKLNYRKTHPEVRRERIKGTYLEKYEPELILKIAHIIDPEHVKFNWKIKGKNAEENLIELF